MAYYKVLKILLQCLNKTNPSTELRNCMVLLNQLLNILTLVFSDYKIQSLSYLRHLLYLFMSLPNLKFYFRYHQTPPVLKYTKNVYLYNMMNSLLIQLIMTSHLLYLCFMMEMNHLYVLIMDLCQHDILIQKTSCNIL